MRRVFLILLISTLFTCPCCKTSGTVSQTVTNSYNPQKYVLNVEEVLEHSTSRYTQGLFFKDNVLYESAGQYGQSAFYKTDFESGRLLSTIPFPKQYFVEGACVLNDKLYILTWNEGICFEYDFKTLTGESKFRYKGEGWGLTTDGKDLIMSDGSSLITFRDPKTFASKRQIPVTYKGKEMKYINELEYIDGKIWANIYTTDTIVIINPLNGVIEGVIDCSNLLKDEDRKDNTDVLNGIAYNETDGSIYITGKNWPKMFKISIVEL